MVLITTVNSELEVEHFAKGNIKFVLVTAVLFFAFSQGKVCVEQFCCMKGKTREKFVCKGRLVILKLEIARVAMVELKFSKCCHDDPTHAQTLFSPVVFRKFLSYSGLLLSIRKSCCVLKKTVVL